LAVFVACGCALLRSAPPAPEEWTFVAFPGSSEPARDRVIELSAIHPVAVGCAAPNPVTFVIEQCRERGPLPPKRDRELMITGNSSSDGYRPDVLRAMMAQPDGRDRFAEQATSLAMSGGYDGMLLDFRLLGPRDASALVALVATLGDAARANGIAPVGIVIPVADTAAYPGRHLGPLTDFLALRMELDVASPGPVTPRDRMSALVGARAAEIGAHRVMLLIPADGYLWRDGEPRARVSFDEAVAAANDWGADLVRDESSRTLRARAPGRGEVWVNDAVLVSELVRDARRLGIRKFGLYGLGGEDKALWPAITNRPVTR